MTPILLSPSGSLPCGSLNSWTQMFPHTMLFFCHLHPFSPPPCGEAAVSPFFSPHLDIEDFTLACNHGLVTFSPFKILISVPAPPVRSFPPWRFPFSVQSPLRFLRLPASENCNAILIATSRTLRSFALLWPFLPPVYLPYTCRPEIANPPAFFFSWIGTEPFYLPSDYFHE